MAGFLCLLIAAPALSLTADEYFDDGNRLFRDDLYWAALLRYRQAQAAGLDTPLLHYNAGIAHYEAQQHVRARESLQRALESPTLRVAAQYNLGLNAYSLGELDEALRWFRLARDQQQNEKLADYARVAIARIRAQRREDSPVVAAERKRREQQSFADLDFRARISFGTDDNVFRSPDQPYVDFADAALPTVTPSVRSGAFMPVDMSVKYKINTYKYEGFFGAYRLKGRYYQDKELDNGNEYSHELSFGNEYQRKDEERGRERRLYSAFKIAQHDEVYYDPDDGLPRDVGGIGIDDRFNYLRYGPELKFRQSFRHLTFGLAAKGQLWNYEETTVVPEYDHEYFLFGLYAQYAFTSTSLLRVTANKSSRRFGDRLSRDLDGAARIGNANVRYDYLDISIMARQRITRNMWFGVEYERRDRTDQHVGYNDYIRDSYGGEFHWDIGKRIEIDASAHYRLYDYTRAFAFHNPVAGRKTLETATAKLSATYRMTRHLFLVLEANGRQTSSNDFRIQYDRNQYVLGVRWQQ